MAKRQKVWAKKRHAQLIQTLGGKCVICGYFEDLEIDHIDGRDYKLTNMDPSARISKYYKELKNGVRLRVLCSDCNKRNPPQKEKTIKVEDAPAF